MRKSVEAQYQLKLAIRDIGVRNPHVSVHQLRWDLAEKGFQAAKGNPLDWYYVAKVAGGPAFLDVLKWRSDVEGRL